MAEGVIYGLIAAWVAIAVPVLVMRIRRPYRDFSDELRAMRPRHPDDDKGMEASKGRDSDGWALVNGAYVYLDENGAYIGHMVGDRQMSG